MISFDSKEVFTRTWPDVETPKAILYICHGCSEHSGRYDGFAKFMNASGYIVFADDHRGFGQTDNNSGYCKGEFVGDTVKDILFFMNQIRNTYPNLPFALLGHSYGSCLAQRIIQLNNEIFACMLTGTGGAPHAICATGKAILAPINAVARKTRVPFIVSNRKFDDTDVPFAWLTKDKAIRQDYIKDNLSNGGITMAYQYGFVKLMSDNSKKKNLKAINKNIHIGIFCGKDDPCGQYGKLPTALAKRYSKYGIKNVSLKLYPDDRHEILNETDKEQIYSDILNFFDIALSH